MSFAEIYERYARDVHRFSLYLSGNRALAEDLTTETFVHAFCGPSKLRVDTVKAYLFAIARNLYRDGMKRQNRQAPIIAAQIHRNCRGGSLFLGGVLGEAISRAAGSTDSGSALTWRRWTGQLRRDLGGRPGVGTNVIASGYGCRAALEGNNGGGR